MGTLKKYWGYGLALVIAISVAGEISYFRHRAASSSTADEQAFSSQAEQDIREALATLRNARSLREWKMSGFTPTDVINNTLALKHSDATEDFCEVLKKLTDIDLSVFESALESVAKKESLACASALLDRIKDYWASQTESFDVSRSPQSEPPKLVSIAHKISSSHADAIGSDLLEKGEFALVFEGALDPIVTRQILEILDERGVKATFLIPGESARDEADVAQMIRKTGNTAGSESTELRDLTLIAMNDAERSIVEGAHAVDVASGTHSSLFAFPYGVSTPSLESYALGKGFRVVHADLDSEDWKTFNAGKLAEVLHAKLGTRDKGIILLHSNLHQTAIALPTILDELAANHRKLVSFQIDR